MTDTIRTPAELAAEGTRLYQQGEYVEAANLFKAASDGYLASEDQLNAAEQRNNQSVALLQSGDAVQALAAVEGTTEIFAAAEDKKRQAFAHGNLAAAFHKLGNNAEAEKHYWESAQLFKVVGDKENRASVLQSISRLQVGSGRYMEALASADSSMENRKKLNFAQRVLKQQLNKLKKLLNMD